MKHATPRTFSFDSRSVMLFAALAMGGTASLQAQTPSTAPRAQSSPFTAGPAASSPAAAPTAAKAAFDRADTNRDGQLNAKEAQTLPAIGNRFEQLDKNRDGMLSREEFAEGAQS